MTLWSWISLVRRIVVKLWACQCDNSVITSEREARSEFLLRIRETPEYEKPAGRPCSRYWEAYISGTESPIDDKRSSSVPIPSTVYGTNAESCHYLLWHVTWRVSIENKGKSWVLAAAGRPWSRIWEAYISGTGSPIDKQSSLVGTPSLLPCQCLLWHVARAARRVSQIFRLLFLSNDWADCVEILYALGGPLVTAYAVVTVGVSLHVRTCTDTPIRWPV